MRKAHSTTTGAEDREEVDMVEPETKKRRVPRIPLNLDEW
jgi:hypothetical protein